MASAYLDSSGHGGAVRAYCQHNLDFSFRPAISPCEAMLNAVKSCIRVFYASHGVLRHCKRLFSTLHCSGFYLAAKVCLSMQELICFWGEKPYNKHSRFLLPAVWRKNLQGFADIVDRISLKRRDSSAWTLKKNVEPLGIEKCGPDLSLN